MIRQNQTNRRGVEDFVDVAKISIDCVETDKQMLDRTREAYVDPSGYTSVARDLDGKPYRVSISPVDILLKLVCNRLYLESVMW